MGATGCNYARFRKFVGMAISWDGTKGIAVPAHVLGACPLPFVFQWATGRLLGSWKHGSPGGRPESERGPGRAHMHASMGPTWGRRSHQAGVNANARAARIQVRIGSTAEGLTDRAQDNCGHPAQGRGQIKRTDRSLGSRIENRSNRQATRNIVKITWKAGATIHGRGAEYIRCAQGPRIAHDVSTV